MELVLVVVDGINEDVVGEVVDFFYYMFVVFVVWDILFDVVFEKFKE